MKKIFSVVLLALATLGLGSCKRSDDTAAVTGIWTQSAYYTGAQRSSAVSFTINGVAYAGLGYNGIDSLGTFRDFYAYSPSPKNSWVKVATFPGKGRYSAVAFSDNNYGYVGTGFDGLNYLTDFWRYDPAANAWTRIANFPLASNGLGRYGAVAFTINNTGYVGTGNNTSTLNDFYQYNAASNTWAGINSFPGTKRQGASSFVLNNVGYVMLGTGNQINPVDVWSYDPGTTQWTRHRDLAVHAATSADPLDFDYSLVVRANAASFAVGGLGYIALGNKVTSTPQSDCWAYDPVADTWTLKTSFTAATTAGGSGGAARYNCIGFSLGSLGYVGLGQTGAARLDDLYQFDPNAVIQ